MDWRALALAAAVGCGNGAETPVEPADTETDEQTAADETVEDTGAVATGTEAAPEVWEIYWEDSLGQRATAGVDLLWFDDRGYAWAIDPETAELSDSYLILEAVPYWEGIEPCGDSRDFDRYVLMNGNVGIPADQAGPVGSGGRVMYPPLPSDYVPGPGFEFGYYGRPPTASVVPVKPRELWPSCRSENPLDTEIGVLFLEDLEYLGAIPPLTGLIPPLTLVQVKP